MRILRSTFILNPNEVEKDSMGLAQFAIRKICCEWSHAVSQKSIVIFIAAYLNNIMIAKGNTIFLTWSISLAAKKSF